MDTLNPNILNIIRQYLPAKDTEKKLYGEVFSPPELICEMLDKLPEEVWSNPNLQWLDPASGIGNFSIVVYYRLMKGLELVIPNEKNRSKHIIEYMIYMVELNPINCEVCRDIFNIIDDTSEPNIKQVDFLEWVSPIKFDIIVGNPPYQGTGRKKIYINFVDKILKFSLNNNGYLIFLTPQLILDFILGIKTLQQQLDTFYNLVYFNSSVEIKKKYFRNIGSDFSYFLIINQPYNYKTKIIFNNMIEISNFNLLWKKKLYLNDLKYNSIANKVLGNYESNLWVRKASRIQKTSDSELSNIETSKYKNKIVYKIKTKTIEYKWTDLEHPDMFKYKILYPTLGKNIILDKEKNLFPGTSFVTYVLCENIKECNFLIVFIKSKLVKFLKDKIFNNNRGPLDSILKNLQKNTKYLLPDNPTDEDIYKYYELEQQEIDLIEKYLSFKEKI